MRRPRLTGVLVVPSQRGFPGGSPLGEWRRGSGGRRREFLVGELGRGRTPPALHPSPSAHAPICRRCTSARSLAAGARAHALSPTHSRVPAAPCSSPLPVPPPGRHGEADLASPGHCLLDEPPRVRWSFPLADAIPRARGSLQLAPACVSSGTARRGRPCEPGLVSPGRPSCLVLVAEDGATTTRTISQVRDRRL